MAVDAFGRKIEYLRLSVADKCNMRCFYCLPEGHREFEQPDHWLTFDEIERVTRVFAGLGIKHIRITGGEPLVRKNLPELVGRIAALDGVEDLSLSTNAALLASRASDLKAAGIGRINVSLDTLRPDRFKDITGSSIEPVLAGLDAASEVGLHPVKINMVAMKGVNDDEFADMVAFCIDKGFTLRLIETMPVGDTGRKASDHYLDLGEVRRQLQQQFDLVPGVMPGGGPARYMKVKGSDVNIGFITPLSQHFCETCNRVRLAVDGTLYLCLGQEDKLELRPLLRAGVGDDELEQAILAAIARKPEKHDFSTAPQQIVRLMNTTGG